MQTVSAERFPQRDRQGLRDFLAYCASEAKRRSHPQIASISLRVKPIDPLAVLESIYEEDEQHAYFERPNAEEAVAGAEAVVGETFAGAARFQQAKAFASNWLTHAIAIGDLDHPQAGPHFFCAFTFGSGEESPAGDERAQTESMAKPFAPATLFLPRWQIARFRDEYTAVANALVTPDIPLDLLTAKIWAAHQKFSAFDYAAAKGDMAPRVIIRDEAGGEAHFEKCVQAALKHIKARDFEKIVLARAIDLRADGPFQPLARLNALRERFPGCYAFSFANGRGQSFVGATPERLLKVARGQVISEAIAGSAPRGSTASTDAAYGMELMRSDKDLREHRHVIDSILRRLSEQGVSARTNQTLLLKLANVQHLRTPISGALPPGSHLLDLAGALHPTPAVGGMPREAALPHISALEGFERGLYSGTLGAFNAHGSGEMIVGIRSALINGPQARLFAGAGIVDGSDPAKERAETDLKLNALLEGLS